VTGLPEKIVAVHESLAAAGLPHAFGGALALAWCTGRARGTIDIDVNVFVGADSAEAVVAALPDGVAHSPRLLAELRREGQVRLWWAHTPVDVFLNSTDYHREVAERVRWETFLGKPLPFLCCHDLAVFKAFFNRTKDWADLEEMVAAGTIEPASVASVLIGFLGADDERVRRLLGLAAS
jgi:hypothetical protein